MTLELVDGRGELFQWDTGRIIEFGEDAVSQAHFTSSEKVINIPYTVEVKNRKAAIPDELLQVPGKLIVYAWVSDTNGGYTKVQVNFPVFARPKPSDYVYTPTEHAGFDRLRTEIGDLSALQTDAKDNLVEAINEVSASGVQPDWNQNDNTRPDYVKNRPFYIGTRNVTVENVPDEEAVLEGFPVFAVGDTVTVNVDGVEHSLVAFDDGGCPTIGDTYSSIDNGEGQLGWQIYVDDANVGFYAKEAHTVSYFVEEVVKIDEKYLPDEVIDSVASVDTLKSVVDTNVYQVRIESSVNSEKWTLARGTYDEIYKKLRRGTPINVEIVLYGINGQYFYNVGGIHYNGEDDCIEIVTIYISGTIKIQIVEFIVKAGGTINTYYYDLK